MCSYCVSFSWLSVALSLQVNQSSADEYVNSFTVTDGSVALKSPTVLGFPLPIIREQYEIYLRFSWTRLCCAHALDYSDLSLV